MHDHNHDIVMMMVMIMMMIMGQSHDTFSGKQGSKTHRTLLCHSDAQILGLNFKLEIVPLNQIYCNRNDINHLFPFPRKICSHEKALKA